MESGGSKTWVISDMRRAERENATGDARRSASTLVRVWKGDLLRKQTSAKRVDTHLWMSREINVSTGGHFTEGFVVVEPYTEDVARG
jgi:hypothetical protein